MAEQKRGPVKPPTLDLTAKKTGDAAKTDAETKASGAPAAASSDSAAKGTAAAKGAPDTAGTKAQSGSKEAVKTSSKPEGKTAAGKSNDGQSEAPQIEKSSRSGAFGAGIAGVVGGGVLGLGLAYGLAMQGYWPSGGQDMATKSDLAALTQKLEGEISAAAGANSQDVSGLKSDLSDLSGKVSSLASSAASAPDLSPLSRQIDSLKSDLAQVTSRVDALALGAEAKPDSAVPAALTALRTQVAALGDKVSALESGAADMSAKLGGLGPQVSGLQADVATLDKKVQGAAAAAATATAASATQLPLALDGFARAIRSGAPYAGELAVLSKALSDLSVPTAVAAHAGSGLPDPVSVRATLEANIPAMLAAQPAAPDASWQQKALDKLKALVAMRPAGPVAGDSPEAIVSRLEAALAAGDFARAASLFDGLPAPMQNASGLAGGDLAALAAAEKLVGTARQQALKLSNAGNAAEGQS